MFDELISTVLQVFVFALVPWLVYFIRHRATQKFLTYIGFIPSTSRANATAVLLSLLLALPVVALSFLRPEFAAVMTDPTTVSGKIRLLEFGGEAIATILLIAVFKTALSEELFFRGFIAKRLINLTTFQIGNVVQALVFGLLHVAILLPISDDTFLLSLFLFLTALFAYCAVYLNERVASGSIVPSWIAHGLANIISYSTIAFLL